MIRASLYKMRRGIAAGLILVMLMLSTGCYGYFPLTRTVYRVNGEIGGTVGADTTQRRVLQSIVMWVFLIIPVYGVASLVDALVMNVIEFWTGDIIEVGQAEKDGYHYAFVPSADGREAVVTISHEGEMISQTRLVKVSDQILEVVNAQGQLLGKLTRNADGEVAWLGQELNPTLANALGI